jgi:hypothetical protein
MKSDRDLMTSWLKLDDTRTSKAPMKCDIVSSETTSPFMASRSLLTIPRTVRTDHIPKHSLTHSSLSISYY